MALARLLTLRRPRVGQATPGSLSRHCLVRNQPGAKGHAGTALLLCDPQGVRQDMSRAGGELDSGVHWAQGAPSGKARMFWNAWGRVGVSGFCSCIARLEIIRMASFRMSVNGLGEPCQAQKGSLYQEVSLCLTGCSPR